MKPLLLLLTALLGAGARAQSRPGAVEALVRDSPFIPHFAPVAGGEKVPAQFEFRGVVAESGGYSFSVFDGDRRESEWVKLNEAGRTFIARHFDEAEDTLTIEHQGRTLTLPLKRAKVQPVAAVPPPPASPPPLPTSAGAPAAESAFKPQSQASNPQEARRLQGLADEIRQRRALRQMPPAQPPAGK